MNVEVQPKKEQKIPMYVDENQTNDENQANIEIETNNEIQANDENLQTPMELAAEIERDLKGLSGSTRSGFIIKVYGIITAQFMMTSIFVMLSIYNTQYRSIQTSNYWLFFVTWIMAMICLYALACYPILARKVPLNYTLLAIFTAAESYGVSCITIFYPPKVVLIATLVTAATTVALTAYALNRGSRDFTIMGSLVFILFFVIVTCFILSLIITVKWFVYLISGVLAIAFGIFIIYDTQMIFGDRAYMFSHDDYILAAMILYIDILQLFLEILRIVGMFMQD